MDGFVIIEGIARCQENVQYALRNINQIRASHRWCYIEKGHEMKWKKNIDSAITPCMWGCMCDVFF